ncbi:hypothetical protein GF327_00510 [Candidatus Woesearchaeota archaeon]|nr:hypothetical protein [Candidatus Woesearchaeota archaeon]
MKFLEEFRKIPNQITLIRLLLIPFFVYFVFQNNIYFVILLYFLFVLGDSLDGILARKLNQASEFGAKFDGFTDDIFYIFIVILIMISNPITSYLVFLTSIFFLLIFSFVKISGLLIHSEYIHIHLHSGKIYATLLTITFFYTFFSNYSIKIMNSFFILMLISGLYYSIEQMIIILKYKNINLDAKSIIFYESE